MKKLLSMATMFLAGFSVTSNAQIEKHEQLKKSEITIIDCRSEQEFKSGHVDGAILIPYDQIGPKISKVVKKKDTPIALYCASGARSGVAYRTLLDSGYTNAVNYGGFRDAKKVFDKKEEKKK